MFLFLFNFCFLEIYDFINSSLGYDLCPFASELCFTNTVHVRLFPLRSYQFYFIFQCYQLLASLSRCVTCPRFLPSVVFDLYTPVNK